MKVGLQIDTNSEHEMFNMDGMHDGMERQHNGRPKLKLVRWWQKVHRPTLTVIYTET